LSAPPRQITGKSLQPTVSAFDASAPSAPSPACSSAASSAHTTGHAAFVIAYKTVVGLYEGVRPDGHAKDVLRDLGETGLLGE